jgi:diguanylate cyclase (GGDEF)-like protein/PAS domain S-box-containing protein
MFHIVQRLRGLFGASPPRRPDAFKNPPPLTLADFRLLALSNANTLFRVGPDQRIRHASPDTLRLLGREPAEFIGQRADMFVLGEDAPFLAASIARDFTAAGQPHATAVRVVQPNGDTSWIEVTSRPLRDAATGAPDEIALIMREITTRKGLELRLATLALGDGQAGLPDRHGFDTAMLALTDGTTGIATRDAFDEAMELEWHRARRLGTQMSLVLLDLDGLAAFRDRFGRQSGDLYLRAVAALMKSAGRRAGDQAAQFRGDELALILPNTHPTGAAQVAEAIRAAVDAMQPPHTDSPIGDNHLAASVAVATAVSCRGDTMKTPAILLLAANAALDHARTNGQNRVIAALLQTPDDIPEPPAEIEISGYRKVFGDQPADHLALSGLGADST